MKVLSSLYGRLVSYQDDPVCSNNNNGARDATDCQANTTAALETKCDGIQYCEVNLKLISKQSAATFLSQSLLSNVYRN